MTLAEGGAGMGARAPLMADPRGMVSSQLAIWGEQIMVAKPLVRVTARAAETVAKKAVRAMNFILIAEGCQCQALWHSPSDSETR